MIHLNVLGNIQPRLQTTPIQASRTRASEVAEFAKQIELPLLEWQQYFLDEALKVDQDNQFYYRQVLGVVARQNGKTHLLRMRILAGLYLFDEQLQVATAQNRDLSLETFRKVVEVIENFDWLRKKVKHITRANGREELQLKNGCRYKIIAPNSSGARGLSADVTYIDEVRQHKSFDAYSALQFTTQTRKNSQSYYLSNAGDHSSVVLNALRQRSLDKIENNTDEPLMFMEWSAKPNRKLNDVDGWKEANPALGRTITLESIKAGLTSPPEIFQTEVLSQWVETMNSAFPQGLFNSLIQPNLALKPDRPTWLGLEISPERDMWALTGSQVLDDGTIAVGLMEFVQSDQPIDDLQIANKVADWSKHYRAEEVIANRFTCDSVVSKLKQAGINANVILGANYFKACDETLSVMSGNRLSHSNQPQLTNSVNRCTKKLNETGSWYVVRSKKATAAISMILAIHKAEEYGQRSQQDIIVVA